MGMDTLRLVEGEMKLNTGRLKKLHSHTTLTLKKVEIIQSAIKVNVLGVSFIY